MFSNIKKVLTIQELRRKILFTLLMMVIIRIGTQIPAPGVHREYFTQWLSATFNGVANFMSVFTGGAFERLSIFALGVTPYITASIILQLMSIIIPSVEEMQRDGQYGKDRLERLTKILAVFFAIVESSSMIFGFFKIGILRINFTTGIMITLWITAGTCILIYMGDLIEKHGIGNGISMILLVNILSGLPRDIISCLENIILIESLQDKLLLGIASISILLVTIILIVILNEAQIRIPLQYIRKSAERNIYNKEQDYIPIQVNAANVIPVIFTSSIFAVPQMIAAILGKGYGSGMSQLILNSLNPQNWFDMKNPAYSAGMLPYIFMMVFFSYFYISLTINPVQMADSLKKHGAVIPGIRPGKPTEAYLSDILIHSIAIGCTGLIIIFLIPVAFSGITNQSRAISGTSLIIIISVILDTINRIKAEMQKDTVKGFIKVEG